MDEAPAAPDGTAYCAEISATPGARPARDADVTGSGTHPAVLPDLPPPVALGRGLLLLRRGGAVAPGRRYDRRSGPAPPEGRHPSRRGGWIIRTGAKPVAGGAGSPNGAITRWTGKTDHKLINN